MSVLVSAIIHSSTRRRIAVNSSILWRQRGHSTVRTGVREKIMVSCGGQRETHLSHESVVDGDKTALRGPRIAGDLSDTTKEWRNRYESHQKKTQ